MLSKNREGKNNECLPYYQIMPISLIYMSFWNKKKDNKMIKFIDIEETSLRNVLKPVHTINGSIFIFKPPL